MASNNTHGNMPPSLRAKQFSPFAALKGLDEALAEKERIRVEKRLLSEERLSELNDKLLSLTVGQIITVVHYDPIEREYYVFVDIKKIAFNEHILNGITSIN